MTARAAALAALLLAAAPARPAAAETLLHLSESAEAARTPDALRATLRAEARAPDAAAAQARVNRAVAAALERARGVAGVEAATGGYRTDRAPAAAGAPGPWVAVQAVTLRGREAGPLLALAGALQADGLALAGLDWALSPGSRRAARDAATAAALDRLGARAREVAARLDLAFAGWREVRVEDEAAARPFAALAQARAAPAPGAVAEDEAVVARVSAVAVLAPR